MDRLYKFLVEPLSDPKIIKQLEEATIDGEIVYSRLAEKHLNPHLTSKGTVLLKSQDPDSEQNPAMVLLHSKPELGVGYRLNDIGENIDQLPGGSACVAESEGVFYIQEGIPKLARVNFNSTYLVKISADDMAVNIDFFPPSTGGRKILIKEVFDKLRKLKIDVEIKTAVLEEVLAQIEDQKHPIYNVNVANGLPPVDGIDGWVEYFVSTEVDFSPAITDQGRLDFYNLRIINPVEKDQLLAIYHPHVEGKNGYDVFGSEIPGKQAKIVKFPAGKNTYPDPENPNRILAKCDGVILEREGFLTVSEVFSIKGSVDFSTGNINNSGSIKVMGDVKSGFRIDVGDTLEVNGIVEDAVINAGSSVQIKSGFVGTGSGVIVAKGNIDLKYVRNQKIFSRESINIKNEVIEAELYAKDKIYVKGGKNMSILGGYAIAGNFIEVNCLGNEYGIPTKVEAGFDYQIENKIRINKQEIERLTAALETIDQNLNQMLGTINLQKEQKRTIEILINQKLKLYESPEAVDDFYEHLEKINSGIEMVLKSGSAVGTRFEYFLTIFEQKISFTQSIKSNKVEIVRLSKELYKPTSARIKVNRKIYPGVSIHINKRKFTVDEEIVNKTFFVSKEDEQIKMISG